MRAKLAVIGVINPSRVSRKHGSVGGVLFFNAVAPVDVEAGHGHDHANTPLSKGLSSKHVTSGPNGSVKQRLMSIKPTVDSTKLNSIEEGHGGVELQQNSWNLTSISQDDRDTKDTGKSQVTFEASPTSSPQSKLHPLAPLQIPGADMEGPGELHKRTSFSNVIHTPRRAKTLIEHQQAVEQAKERSWWHKLCCCCFPSHKATSASESHVPVDDFSDIYFFAKPVYYFRAVELCIMFNCLYMALWATNFVFIVEKVHLSYAWTVGAQLIMCVPLLVVLPMIGFISETCSLLSAVSHLNLEVICESRYFYFVMYF